MTRVLVVSTYELGHQPLGVAAPAGVLRARGHEVRALDLSLEPWDSALDDWADLVAVSTPMHTAARLARELAPRVTSPIVAFGLYADTCADVADTVAGGRDPVAALVTRVERDRPAREPATDARALPARDLLPPADHYVRLAIGDELRLVGSVEASTGCAHRCRHCPVPVVHDGRIRIVAVDDVLADVEQQVAAGARHVSFTDPDFFNGVHHARRVADALHGAFPDVTFDCTVKVEHVLRHDDAWRAMADAGCLFVVSAFESVDDAILRRLDKHHTAADASRAVALLRGHGIEVRPSWMPFTPWTAPSGPADIVEFVAAHDLVGSVDPVQYTIRLLLPRGSLLLPQLPALPWDPEQLSYTWESPLDPLQRELTDLVDAAGDEPIAATYARVREAVGLPPAAVATGEGRPRLTESWFCCAEPSRAQLGRLRASSPAPSTPCSS